jgi:hypothetical protein
MLTTIRLQGQNQIPNVPFQSELADNAEFLLYCKCGGQSEAEKPPVFYQTHFQNNSHLLQRKINETVNTVPDKWLNSDVTRKSEISLSVNVRQLHPRSQMVHSGI